MKCGWSNKKCVTSNECHKANGEREPKGAKFKELKFKDENDDYVGDNSLVT